MITRSKIPELISVDSRISIGRFTYGNPQLLLWGDSERITVGAFCSIANEVVISGGGEHRTDWITTFPMRTAFEDPLSGKDGHPASKGETRIGNDVWIGTRAMILSGVNIGDGAVIGAGAVVASDVPPYAIVAGNPAKIIKYRFDFNTIKKLQKIRWWEWDINKIKMNTSLLCCSDIEKFLENHGSK